MNERNWQSPDTALLLVGHGTRDTQGQAAMRQLGEMVAARLPDVPVEVGFLELAEPDIARAFTRLLESGRRRVVAVPVILLAAGHAKQDIPDALRAAAKDHPEVSVAMSHPLECHPALVELANLRLREAIDEPPGDDTLHILVGRGSRDAEANSELARFARLRWEAAPVGWSEICFAAMTEPTLERTLDMASRFPLPRVVVQPHLLFPGRLYDRIAAAVDQVRARHADKAWRLTAPLGAHPLLVQALCARAAEAQPL